MHSKKTQISECRDVQTSDPTNAARSLNTKLRHCDMSLVPAAALPQTSCAVEVFVFDTAIFPNWRDLLRQRAIHGVSLDLRPTIDEMRWAVCQIGPDVKPRAQHPPCQLLVATFAFVSEVLAASQRKLVKRMVAPCLPT